MKITLKGTNLSITDAIDEYVRKKILQLEQITQKIQLVRIELEFLTEHKTKTPFRAEATIDAPKHVYRAESRENDLYSAIDTLLPKLLSQLKKDKLRQRVKTRRTVRRLKEGANEI